MDSKYLVLRITIEEADNIEHSAMEKFLLRKTVIIFLKIILLCQYISVKYVIICISNNAHINEHTGRKI